MSIIHALFNESTNFLLVHETEELRNESLKNMTDDITFDIVDLTKDDLKKYEGCRIAYKEVKRTSKQLKKYIKNLKNEVKIYAHLTYKDGKTIDIPVKIIGKDWDKSYICELYINTSKKNKTLTICKDSKVVEIDAPEKCEHPGCNACSMRLKFNI